jgi:tetratricopeptide (TPR) repeat protein
MNLGLWFDKLLLKQRAFGALVFGRRKRALAAYEDITRLDPKDGLAWSTVGNMRMELGDAAGATDAFLRLLEAHPNDADSWFNLGYIYEQREQLGEAERCFRRALDLNDKLDRAWYGLGLALIRLDRLREAIDALQKNIKLQPFSPYGYYQLAMTLHHLGESDDAWRTYEQLKTFEPRYAATLKKDMESTRARAADERVSGSGSSGAVQLSSKEVLATST